MEPEQLVLFSGSRDVIAAWLVCLAVAAVCLVLQALATPA
jgi:hypothetical protein